MSGAGLQVACWCPFLPYVLIHPLIRFRAITFSENATSVNCTTNRETKAKHLFGRSVLVESPMFPHAAWSLFCAGFLRSAEYAAVIISDTKHASALTVVPCHHIIPLLL